MKLSGTRIVFSRSVKPTILPFITPSFPLRPLNLTFNSNMPTTPSDNLGNERLCEKPKL